MQRYHSTPAAKRRAENSASTNKRSFGALMAPLTQRAQVNPYQLKMVMANSRAGFQRAVLKFIIKDTVECGFDVRLVYKSDPIELSETEQSVIDTHWPHFVREAMQSLMVAGMVVVQAAGPKGAKVPRVVPFDFVHIYFVETATAPRQYWVEDVNGDGTVLDVLLFVLNPPDARGTLTSNGAALVDTQTRMARMMCNHDEADFQRTHPTWVFGVATRGGIGRPDPNEHDEFAVGEVDRSTNAYLQKVNLRELTELERMEREMKLQHARVMNSIEQDPDQAALPAGVRMPPFARRYMMPVNQSLVAAPVPQLNEYLVHEQEQATRHVMEAYGVPVSMMDATKGSAQHASAQSSLDVREWMITVTNHQKMLAQFVRETYMYVNVDTLDSYVRLFTSAAIADTDRALQAMAATPAREKPQSPASKARASEDRDVQRAVADDTPEFLGGREGKDGSDADDDEDEEDEEEEEPKPKKKKKTRRAAASDSDGEVEQAKLFTNEDGNKQIGETQESLERATQLLSVTTETIEALMRAEIKLDVAFRMFPAVSLEEIKLAHDDGLIDHDAYAEMTATLLGLPKSMMVMGKEDVLADAKFRKKVKDILEPPEPKAKPGVPGAGAAKPKPKPKAAAAKPRPKPSASSSSSSASSSASKPAASAATTKAERTIDLNINIHK